MKVEGCFVDGYHAETRTIYEFLGCFFHGCSTCYEGSMMHPLASTPMWKLYKETEERIQKFKALGYQVEFIWEHEFAELKKTDDTLKTMDFKVR